MCICLHILLFCFFGLFWTVIFIELHSCCMDSWWVADFPVLHCLIVVKCCTWFFILIFAGAVSVDSGSFRMYSILGWQLALAEMFIQMFARNIFWVPRGTPKKKSKNKPIGRWTDEAEVSTLEKLLQTPSCSVEVTFRLDGRGTLEVGPGFDKSFKRDTALRNFWWLFNLVSSHQDSMNDIELCHGLEKKVLDTWNRFCTFSFGFRAVNQCSPCDDCSTMGKYDHVEDCKSFVVGFRNRLAQKKEQTN